MKEIKISKKIEIIIKVLIILSFTALGPLLMHFYDSKIALINGLITLFTAIIVFKKVNLSKLNKKKLIISLIIAAYVDGLYMQNSNVRFTEIILSINTYINRGFINQIIPSLISVMSYPAIVAFIYWFIERHYPKITKGLKDLDKLEKKYIQIVGITSLIIVSGISIYTSAFQNVTYENNAITDVIYTSDNGTIIGEDAWLNISHPENDIRQPLFAIFALPFSIPAHMISNLLFFIPKEISYGVALSIIQFLLLALSVIMLAKLLKLNDNQKIYFYIFFSLSFPYILFGLLIEQYVLALFYLILTIYQYEHLKGEVNYSYLGATSTLITSGIIFPLITKSKNIKKIIKKYYECFISFLMIAILSGQFSQIMTIKSKMKFFMSEFAGTKDTFIMRWNKYTTFIENIFKINQGHIEKFLNYDAYRMSIPTTMSIIGIIILGILVISIIINRKEYLARVSALWILYSFIILCVIGWGTSENGLILYSLYFSWAFYILFYLFLKKIFKNNKVLSIIMIIVIGIMFIYTGKELLNIIKFALLYYRR